ncbi:zinc-binding alcohol dehydrogenase family protein [Aspergillus clavatus NRRL 1]|uniref:Zinc-binding dehydrogenase family oxidoreductase, putative n=1 Tax=Aspergillus clavatus (strain ATCC 1007 / CBS 513.65 / DSM 816 / NCTC 3887 / NRRL 1 / QM 1276 / 107) TaxID=344612 RepID=A1CN12_ASPCL|nr:zinc-binding dehydrogenase family oxidoreductase, putative [Aspergillus clavatus NRRL 1]EAW08949.1 zinc-binding dehydrogenase family oxidoreductase, putative [Aspergillus clavatus NRRL 1]
MTELPSKQRAIVALDDGSLDLRNDVEVPVLEEDMILIKNAFVALNPIDSKMVGKLASPGAIAGMDFAGEVVSIGSKVQTAAPIKLGDRVCGTVPGMHSLTPTVGAFAEFVGATDLTTIKIPEGMSFEQAATLGSGIGTVGLALFRSLDVPGSPKSPSSKPVEVLVYGGSTATGTLAIQLLKLSGLSPIATCSPSNFELVKSYGATAVFDYHQETCADDIRKFTRNSLKFVLDCISEPETMQFCYKCLGRSGGKYTALEPFPEFLHTRPKTVVPDWVLGPTLLGKKLSWPEPFGRPGGDQESRKFGFEWFGLVQELLNEGKLKTHPHRVVGDSLAGALDGLELLRNKKVSGQKLVCRVV